MAQRSSLNFLFVLGLCCRPVPLRRWIFWGIFYFFFSRLLFFDFLFFVHGPSGDTLFTYFSFSMLSYYIWTKDNHFNPPPLALTQAHTLTHIQRQKYRHYLRKIEIKNGKKGKASHSKRCIRADFGFPAGRAELRARWHHVGNDNYINNNAAPSITNNNDIKRNGTQYQ